MSIRYYPRKREKVAEGSHLPSWHKYILYNNWRNKLRRSLDDTDFIFSTRAKIEKN